MHTLLPDINHTQWQCECQPLKLKRKRKSTSQARQSTFGCLFSLPVPHISPLCLETKQKTQSCKQTPLSVTPEVTLEGYYLEPSTFCPSPHTPAIYNEAEKARSRSQTKSSQKKSHEQRNKATKQTPPNPSKTSNP